MLEDVLVEIHQAIDVATVSGNILGEMMDAFASIINLNLNVVMRYLAAIMIIVAVAPLIATFYGMNVPLPGQGSPWAWPVLVGLSLLAAALTAWGLRRRRWL
jgi:magnesium transporter